MDESRPVPLDTSAKKKILRNIPYGLYALTTRRGDEVNVFTATWVSQCSFEPPLLMVAVRRDSYSHELLRQSGLFALNQVGKDSQAILAQFLKTVQRSPGKFNNVPFRTGASGLPILDDAVAALECRVIQFHEVGDHSVVIGEIVSAHLFRDEPPLVCSDTGWRYAG